MKTDFSTWDRVTLEKLARDALDANEVLKADLKTAIAAWRELLRKHG